MRVLAQMPETPAPVRQPDTDYDKFLDGQVWCIEEADVPMPLHKLRATLISKARRLKLRLQTRLVDQQLFVHALDA